MVVVSMIFIIILVVGLTIASIIYGIGKWLRPRIEKSSMKLDDIILNSLEWPLVSSIIGLTIWAAIYYGTELPALYPGIFIAHIQTAIIILMVTWISANFITQFLRHLSEQAEISNNPFGDPGTLHVVQIIAKYIIWIIALMLILSILNINIAPLLATGGVLGIIISLGGQDLIGNFLSGITIALDQPFRIGDRVKIGNNVGDIIHLGPRSTRIQLLDNQVLTVPNTMLTNDIVINYAMNDELNKVRLNINVKYGSDIALVKDLLLSIGKDAQRIEGCPHCTAPEVYFYEFGDSALNFQLVIYTHDFSRVLQIKDYANTRIEQEFRKHGICIPFPQMAIHILDREGGLQNQ